LSLICSNIENKPKTKFIITPIIIMITQKQKELLEKELKEVNISYVIGFAVSIAVGAAVFFILKPLSSISIFGVEEYFRGFWLLVWALLFSLLTFLKWIKGNKLTDRKKETELKLAEEIVG